MRILLTEGSGMTARQVATRLQQLGHDDPTSLVRRATTDRTGTWLGGVAHTRVVDE